MKIGEYVISIHEKEKCTVKNWQLSLPEIDSITRWHSGACFKTYNCIFK